MPNLAVFSTSVEVFPHAWIVLNGLLGLLHVRGGVSMTGGPEIGDIGSSPRPWRCFYETENTPEGSYVFSTSVEVFPDEYQ